MDKKLKIFGIVTSIVVAMSLGIFCEQFSEKVTAEKQMDEIINSKNEILLFVGGKIEGGENGSGGCRTYKINENESVEFIEIAKYGQPEWEPCNEHENCFSVTATANDTLPKNVKEKDGGYGAGKKPEILKTDNTTAFNETGIK